MEEKTKDKYQEPVEGDPIALKEQPIEQSQEVFQPKAEQEPEAIDSNLIEKEVVKEIEPAIPTPVQPTDDSTEDSKSEEQVKILREIAFEKGIDEAIEEAKKLDNPYLLDEFHDDLVDKFYKKLVEAGKLEQK